MLVLSATPVLDEPTLLSGAPYASRAVIPRQVGVQYWMTFATRRSKLARSAKVEPPCPAVMLPVPPRMPVYAAMPVSPVGSMRTVENLYGESHWPMRSCP